MTIRDAPSGEIKLVDSLESTKSGEVQTLQKRSPKEKLGILNYCSNFHG